jgi:hypothetical protein
MIDFDELITWRHEQFLIEEGMNESVKPEDKNGWDEEELEDDRDFTHDDIPF